jgi:ELWxxDGT repeat protein
MRVKDNPTGTDDSSPSRLVVLNGSALFAASDGVAGAELWKSDGTSAGTMLVADIRPGPDSSAPFLLTRVGGTVFFTADDGTNGAELWKSDGTAGGTVLVKDINPGAASSNLSGLTDINGTSSSCPTRRDGWELVKTRGSRICPLVEQITPGTIELLPRPAHECRRK